MVVLLKGSNQTIPTILRQTLLYRNLNTMVVERKPPHLTLSLDHGVVQALETFMERKEREIMRGKLTKGAKITYWLPHHNWVIKLQTMPKWLLFL